MEEFSKKLLDLITGKFSGLNLTRITDPVEFYQKQILDSVLPYEQSEIFQKAISNHKLVIDVGFGGGFPILPLAFLLPEVKFVGIEATRKKVTAVNEMAMDLGLVNVNCIHLRLEELLVDKPAVITFKAVGKVQDYLSIINSTAPIEPFFYKGQNFFDLEPDFSQVDGFLLTENRKIDVPGVDGRYLVGYRNVPRGTIQKTKEKVVKLSSLLKK